MTWLERPAVLELLREASRRGPRRARELAEHARERYSSGPTAKRTTLDGRGFYFREAFEADQFERNAVHQVERQDAKNDRR